MTSVSSLLSERRRSDSLLYLLIFVIVLGLTPLLILAGLSIGFGLILSGLLASLLVVLVVRWPAAGFFVVAACAVVVEEETLTLASDFTDHLYIFSWPPSLEGLLDRPIGLLMLFSMALLVCHRLLKRQSIRGGALLLPFICFMLCVGFGAVHGLTSGGTLKIVVLEVRPFYYLFLAYLLAYNVITSISQIKAFFWIIILGAGVKGLQGLYLLFGVLHGSLAGHDELMAHEDSFFFAAFLLLIILFCLCYRQRAQLIGALIVSPLVIISMVANQRRADYIALLVGILAVAALIFVTRPRFRKKIVVAMLIGTLIGGSYVAAFSHSSSSFASPARSVVAVFAPSYTDIRDIQSNLYRLVENYDLKFSVRANLLLGMGFGKQFLEPVPLVNIQADDPYYLFIPHNNIYWIWMRLGSIGYLAFWYLIGAIVVRGSMIARRLRNPYLHMVAIFVVAITLMEIVVAFADYQLFFYRPVIYTGLLVGILMRLPALDDEAPESVTERGEARASELVESAK